MKKIVHYHIYKNAGCSIMRDLKKHFGKDGVVELDTDKRYIHKRPYNAKILKLASQENPDIEAFTCHSFTWNAHLAFGDEAFPVILIRHPLLHAASVFRFEKARTGPSRVDRQMIARAMSFPQWIEYSLTVPTGVDCQNYQSRMVMSSPERQPLPNSFIKNSLEHYRFLLDAYLDSLPCYGVVEKYQESMAAFNEALEKEGLAFRFSRDTRANVTKKIRDWRKEVQKLEDELGEELVARFRAQNELDFYIFDRREAELNTGLAEEGVTSAAAGS